MAINPLILFTGLSVATVGGIVVVQQVNKTAPSEQPAIVQKQAGPVVAPLLEPKLNAKNQTPVKKLAAIEPKKFPPAKLDDKTLKAVTAPITAKTSPSKTGPSKTGPVAPSFDVVRVEKDGGAVVVGKAAPNAEIALKLNGKVIGKTRSNKQGDWVFIPEQLIPSGNHELVIESQEVGKKPVRSKQSIYIAIAKKADQKPLVVVAAPNAPTKVLQVPKSQPAPVKMAKVKMAKVEPKPAAVSNTTPNSTPNIAPNTTIVTPQVLAVKKTGETIVKKASPKAAMPPIKVAQKVASKIESKAAATKVTKVASLQPPKQKQLKNQKLVFGTVDYNDQGNIVFSGKATAGKTVRLYIDNIIIGDAKADVNGLWVFKGKKSIKQGVHELRADQVTATGRVAQRTAVPFMRAAPRKVAALIKNRTKTTPTPSPTNQVPTKAPVSAKTMNKAEPKASVSQKPKATKLASNTTALSPSAPAIVNAVQPTSKAVANAQPTTENTPNSTQEKTELVSHVVIQPGNNLWNISRVIYGKGIAYTTIYQANKTQVKDPNRIYPGQILETPGAMSTGSIGPDERGKKNGGEGENG